MAPVGEPLASWLAGTAVPRPDDWLLFHETGWSYRRPISYEVVAASGVVVATVAPIDAHTRSTSLLVVSGVPTLVLTTIGGGGTVVTRADGDEVGRYRPIRTLTASRLALTVDERRMATLNHPALTAEATITTHPDGRPVARIPRAAGNRFAGASRSWLQWGDRAAEVPVPLSVAAVPALDTFHRDQRRRRRF